MEVIKKYFDLTKEQEAKLTELLPLYTDWNAKINVISRKDMDQFYTNHVLHALSIVKLHDLSPYQSVMDIGTGGGFPGIPLAIMYPDIEFMLVDSIQKKTKVVYNVAENLDLENVTVVNDRFENIREKHDAIVSRAVAPAIKLIKLTQKSLKKDGVHVFLKGGDLTDEQSEVTNRYKNALWNETSLSDIYEEDFFETKKLISLSGLKA